MVVSMSTPTSGEISEVMAALGRKRWRGTTKQQRSDAMRELVRKRWDKVHCAEDRDSGAGDRDKQPANARRKPAKTKK